MVDNGKLSKEGCISTPWVRSTDQELLSKCTEELSVVNFRTVIYRKAYRVKREAIAEAGISHPDARIVVYKQLSLLKPERAWVRLWWSIHLKLREVYQPTNPKP
jgi:hypothetical protein